VIVDDHGQVERLTHALRTKYGVTYRVTTLLA
jgi:hypothetical protein